MNAVKDRLSPLSDRLSPIADTYTHFTRKIKTRVTDGHVPTDILSGDNIEPVLCGTTGLPDCSDSLAYDPIQGLVAVGTPEGRIKISGRTGVEVTLKHATKFPTLSMIFLPHRGGLVRVTHEGDVQLFSIAEQEWMSGILIDEETINDVAVVHGEQYLLLACGSGIVRVVSILDSEGEVGMGPVADLALQPYSILPSTLEAKGPVVAIAVTKNGNRPLAAIVHQNSGVVIWDLRAQKIVAAARDDENDPSKPTSVCWLGSRSNCFAVGYDDGSILVWGIPAQQQTAGVGYEDVVVEQEPDLVTSIRLVPDGVEAAPVRSLFFINGNHGTPNGEDCILVLGGQSASDPEMLTLAPLHPQLRAKPVPWFGTVKSVALVPPSVGAAASHEGHARALLILTEGGRLVSHDLLDWEPTPLTVAVQELPPVCVARFVYTLSDSQVDTVATEGGGTSSGSERVFHSLNLDKLRECSRLHTMQQQRQQAAAAAISTVSQLLPGGIDPAFAGGKKAGLVGTTACGHPSGLLITGHRDGRLRAWDATAEVPTLLWTMPSFTPGQERFKAITTFEVCPLSGIVAVGHADGDVRVYQFSDKPQAATLTTLDESLVPYDGITSIQPPGFQYVLKYGCHTADITAITLGTRLKIIAVADASGQVSVLDLLSPSQLFKVQAMPQAVAQLALGGQRVPSTDGSSGGGDVERIVLFAAGQDSSCCALSLSDGLPVGKTLKPKNGSKPLAMALLDESGMPIPPMHGHTILPWANNEALDVVMPQPRQSRAREPTSGYGQQQQQYITTSPSLEVQELPFDDEDIEYMDEGGGGYDSPNTIEKKKKSGGGGLKGLFRRNKSKSPTRKERKEAKQREKEAAAAMSSSNYGSPDQQQARFDIGIPSPALTAESAAAAGGGASPDRDYDIAVAMDAFDRMQVQTNDDGSLHQPVEESLVEYPYIEILGNEPVLASFVMLCTTDYLRLYNTESIYLGDRVTDRKARYGSPLLAAAVFRSLNGPGVVSVSVDGELTIYSVPNLTCLYSELLEGEEAMGFPWAAIEESSGLSSGKEECLGISACSLDGQLLLVGCNNELMRLAVIKDCVMPKAPSSLYDWDLATNHLRMRKEEARNDRSSTGGGGGGGKDNIASLNAVFNVPVEPLDDLEYLFDDLDAAAVGGGGSKNHSRQQSRTSLEVPGTSGTLAPNGDRPASPKKTPVGAATAALQGAGAKVAGAGVMVAGAGAKVAGAGVKAGAKVAKDINSMLRPGSRSSDRELDPTGGDATITDRQSKEYSESTRRAELLGNRRSSFAPGTSSSNKKAPPQMVKRTTSEIRRVYGHAPASAAARGQAERNKQMLAERGEKLKGLERQGEELKDEAEDFAGMAKELEDLMGARAKNWWKM